MSDELDYPIEYTRFYKNPEYKRVCQVGIGGNGAVYCLKKNDRFYALKVAKRLRDTKLIPEAEKLMALNMPLSARVYEHSPADSDEAPWMLMDFIPGLCFSYFSSDDYEISDRVFVSNIGILAYTIMKMHEQGMIHRDIKPENILIDPALRPHLIDWGETTEKRSTDSLHGTVCFCAPEVLRDGKKQISPKSDIFSFGATIINFLTGRFPHYDFYTSVDGAEKYREIIESDQRFVGCKENLLEDFNDLLPILEEFEYEDDQTQQLTLFHDEISPKVNGILANMISLGYIDESYQQGTSFYNQSTPLKQACIDLAYRCMNPAPIERPSAEEVLNELFEIVQKHRSDFSNDFESILTQIDSTNEIFGTQQFVKKALEKGFQSRSSALETIRRKYFPNINSDDSYYNFVQTVQSLSQA